MGNSIAEALVRNRMKRMHEASSLDLRNYKAKLEKILNLRLGSYETGVVVEDLSIISESPDTMTFTVGYSVDVRIPMYGDEDGSTNYEENQEYREQTITIEKKDLV